MALITGATLTSCDPSDLGAAYLARKVDARPAEYGVQIERSVPVTTSDSVELRADVYRPAGLNKTPTILVRLPYSKTAYNALIARSVGRFWAERGYTAVIQGTRGRYESGGDYYPLWHERADGLDTLKWLKRQEWFDGRLALWGGSYFGYTEWVVSGETDPAPSAMMVELASANFYEMFYPGGAFSLESALYWAV